MTFDPTITLTFVVSALVLLVGVAVWAARLDQRVRHVEARMDRVVSNLTKLVDWLQGGQKRGQPLPFVQVDD